MISLVNDVHGKAVFLAVDEITKTKKLGHEHPAAITRAIGACLDNFPCFRFNAIVSTLDWKVAIKGTVADSGRGMLPTVNTRLKHKESQSIFLEYTTNIVVQRVIAFSNGHPRSLALLKLALNQTPNPESTWDLLTEMRTNLDVAHFVTPTENYIKAALRGDQIRLEDVIDPPEFTVQMAVEAGYFLNALGADDESIVPQISPLTLYFWAIGKSSDAQTTATNAALKMLKT